MCGLIIYNLYMIVNKVYIRLYVPSVIGDLDFRINFYQIWEEGGLGGKF